MLDLMAQNPAYPVDHYGDDNTMGTVAGWYQKHPSNWSREDVMHWLTTFVMTPENQRHYEFYEREFPLEQFNEYAGPQLLQLDDRPLLGERKFISIVVRGIQEAARQYIFRTHAESPPQEQEVVLDDTCMDHFISMDGGLLESEFVAEITIEHEGYIGDSLSPQPADHHFAVQGYSDVSSNSTHSWENQVPQASTSESDPDDGYRSNDSEESEPADVVPKKKPRKGPKRIHKTPHLWEFLLDTLRDRSSGPQPVIRWVDPKKGVFRIENSKAVARDWGIRKNNPNMKYENMARGIRFSRDEGYFAPLPTPGQYPKKKCFCFGKLARDNSAYLRSIMNA